MSTERLFFAVAISDQLRERLKELQEISLETLRDHGIRNVRTENLHNSHITIRFLGEVEETQKLIAALQGKRLLSTCFNFSLDPIGVFNNALEARVLWVGVSEQARFSGLRREIDLLIQQFDFGLEKRALHPHLTLARFRAPQDIRECMNELRQLTDVCSMEQYTVDQVVLYSSKLSPQGATHTKRALLKLT